MKAKIPEEVLKEIFPRKLKRPQASEKVYNQLKKWILFGKLKKGQRLVEEEIAKSFNVSRTVVGKAFLQLKKDKLINKKFKKGTFVA
jgi:DNA-binding GntR family transcriptional regulator